LANASYAVATMEDASERGNAVVAVVADLIFGARIRGAAQQAGVAVRFVRSSDALLSEAAGARLVLLDLETRWLDAPSVIAELKARDTTAGVQVIAFVSHVRADAIESARQAGADRVLARSAFVRELPQLLRPHSR
jgi:CheY-like chemotaxis protein